MKHSKQFLTITIVLLTLTTVFGQRTFTVHEDRVKPSGVEAYEATAKKLVEACKRHNVQEENWLAASMDDGRYLYITEIENMAELDREGFSELSSKMGEAAFGQMMSGFSGYDEHGDYIIQLREDLSYQPGGIDTRTEGQEYRRFIVLHVYPEDWDKALEITKGFKDLYTRKSSQVHYRVYQSGYGQMGPYIQFAISGKSQAELAQRMEASGSTMAAEVEGLIKRFQAVSWKVETHEGAILPDLSYTPK